MGKVVVVKEKAEVATGVGEEGMARVGVERGPGEAGMGWEVEAMDWVGEATDWAGAVMDWVGVAMDSEGVERGRGVVEKG